MGRGEGADSILYGAAEPPRRPAPPEIEGLPENYEMYSPAGNAAVRALVAETVRRYRQAPGFDFAAFVRAGLRQILLSHSEVTDTAPREEIFAALVGAGLPENGH
jgi:hypothetical protein